MNLRETLLAAALLIVSVYLLSMAASALLLPFALWRLVVG